jgi:hypothetical protein
MGTSAGAKLERTTRGLCADPTLNTQVAPLALDDPSSFHEDIASVTNTATECGPTMAFTTGKTDRASRATTFVSSIARDNGDTATGGIPFYGVPSGELYIASRFQLETLIIHNQFKVLRRMRPRARSNQMAATENRIVLNDRVADYPILRYERRRAREVEDRSSAISGEDLAHSHALLLRSTPGAVFHSGTSRTLE